MTTRTRSRAGGRSPQPTPPTHYQLLDPLLIDRDPTQPRQEFDAAAQAELEASIQAHGIHVPLRVVAKPDGRYQLLYGERRLRAALAQELALVPCIVDARAPSWLDALALQLSENTQRAELRPLEVAQTLWRGILGANIAALEQEQGDAGQATAALLGAAATPTAQIRALEARLCALAGVASVADYFGGGRVRVPRKTLLGRFGMAAWSESRLKKLFQTLDVAPAVQDLLAGVDVSARALRDLAQHDPATQAALVTQAQQAAGDGDLGTVLRSAIDTHAPARSTRRGPTAADGVDDDDDALALPADDRAGGDTFTPDPALAWLTGGGGSAPLITAQVAPQRGSTPPAAPVGAWDDDQVLMLESALETIRTLCDDAGVLTLSPAQLRRLTPLWATLVAQLRRAGLEATA